MLRRMLPPPGPAGMLAAAQIVNSVVTACTNVCSVLFFSLVVGLPAGQVAAGISPDHPCWPLSAGTLATGRRLIGGSAAHAM